jgi:hypothetical protein
MTATRSTRRKKPGLIRGTATKVAALATSVGAKIGESVREPAGQIASFVHETAQHLPLIGRNGTKRKRARSKVPPVTKAKRRPHRRARRA